MRLLHYTIIIWMSCARAGEPFEPIHIDPVEPPSVRHEPFGEPIKPIHPVEPQKPSMEPIKPIYPRIDPILPIDPVLPKPILPHLDIIQSEQPSLVSKSVQTYLSQSQVPKALQGVELPKGSGATVEQVRTQYLEKMQKDFDQTGVITLPTVVLNPSSFIQKGVGPSLVEWMVSLTDGLSFAEHLSQLPTTTEAQKQQFSFSPEKKAMYESAKTALVQSSQTLLEMITSLQKQDFFVMGTKRDLTEQEMKGLSDKIDALDALLESSMAQHTRVVTLLCEQSPSYDEAMLSAVIDTAPGVEAWKAQEKISEQSTTVLFPSYETFISGFPATNVKEYVQKFVGSATGQFTSVQALITALDKVSFILESKSFWLSFRNKKYSKATVDTILSSLVKEYPDTYIPSKKFIFNYCKLHRSFKPVSFFIPQFDQFLIDAKTLTIDELAKKYGQGSDSIKSLLNNMYGAVYVLQQTNQDTQARDLTEVVTKILQEHPEMTPAIVAQVVASENMPLRTVFNAELELAKVAVELKNEMVTLQANQFQKSLTSLSTDLSQAQSFISTSFSKAEEFLTDKAADGVTALIKNSRLGKVLMGVIDRLQSAEASFEIVSRVKENIAIHSSADNEQFEEAFEHLQTLKQDAMSFAVQVEYEKAKAQEDTLMAHLLETLQDALKKELLSYTESYLATTLLGSLESKPLSGESLIEGDGGSSQTDALIDQIVEKSVLEQENEKDYQACIWASNKMGMMESKIASITALLKIKKTPLFLVGYKSALKDIEADFVFLSTSKSVQKCLNVIAKRSFLLQKIKELEAAVKALQKEIDDEQKSKVAL